jgi:catecholate siderophore receptor
MRGADRRPGRIHAMLLASTSIGLALSFGAAHAQAADSQDKFEIARNDEVVIQGRAEPVAVDRLPQPIEDQPQTITVIDAEQLKAQGASTLDQAVRNVPGITANTGEGGGATAGDQFRIRGFDAGNDISSDGLRDFGVYTRDNFNVESVQVFLGPSGATFGRGSFGGAINTTTKMAHAGDASSIEITGGTADLARVTGDFNRDLGPHSAVRLNLMAHQNEFADIDGPDSKRWGAAASIGLGLGQDTTLLASYFHQSDDRVPYYGVPVTAPSPADIARPLPVDRSTFFGTNVDRDETDADVVTAKLTHKAAGWLTLHNDTRVGVFSREFLAVAPSCSASTSSPNPNAPGTCAGNFFDGDPATIAFVTRGGATGPYFLDQWGAQNVTTGIADYHLGALRSQTVFGLDATYESADRRNTSAYDAGVFPRPPANALDPDPVWTNPAFIDTNTRRTNSTDFAVFGSEQLWLTDQLSLLGGLRWERYHIESDLITYGAVDRNTGVFTATTPNTVASSKVADDLVSPRVSLIYQPDERKIVYASWARSSQPATGTAAASVGTPIAAAQSALDPTTSETYEIGARTDLWSPAIILGVSLFSTERDNAKETDPLTGGVVSSGDQQRVRGAEISLTGNLTDRWAITASYTYLDTETLLATDECSTAAGAALPCPSGVTDGSEVPDPNAIGKPIPFAARNAATLWTTYDATNALTLGLGARYTEKVWLNNTNTAQAPDYVSIDAMARYAFSDDLAVQLNATNLLDREDNYDQVTSGRAAHAPGRAFAVSLTKSF